MKSIIIVLAMLITSNALAQSNPMGSMLEWVVEVTQNLELSGYKIYYGLEGSALDQEILLEDTAAVRAADESEMLPGEELYEHNLLQSPFQIGSQYCFQVTAYLNTAIVGVIRESVKSDIACGLVVPTLKKVIRVRLTK